MRPISVCSSEDESDTSLVEDDDEEEVKLVLVVRNDLKMGKGKVGSDTLYCRISESQNFFM